MVVSPKHPWDNTPISLDTSGWDPILRRRMERLDAHLDADHGHC